jgi:hypothetical protein
VQDEFAGVRLPDLPNAGYSTAREKALSDEIMFFVRGCERNRLLLLTIVCDGKEKFRPIARKAWSHLRVDTDMADAVFGYLQMLAGKYPHLQRDELIRQQGLSPIDKVWGTRS